MPFLPLLVISVSVSLILYIIFFLFLCASVYIVIKFGKLYGKSFSSGAQISLAQIISMAMKQANIQEILHNRIMAKKAGIDITPSSIEAHSLTGGNINQVVCAIIAAKKAGIELSFDHACAIDLAGRNVFDVVKTCIYPKEILCPDPTKGSPALEVITKDGIQLKVKARITVRANLDKLIGGTPEETIIARVGESIITTIGTFQTYKEVLAHPDRVSKHVMEMAPDAETAFHILSIHIAEITVGENVGAKLQAELAESEKCIMQAEAKKRKELAAAKRQEIKILAEENRVKILAAEAEVQKAIIQAFREGNLGIMDYHHLKNIQADTDMKKTLSKSRTQNTQ